MMIRLLALTLVAASLGSCTGLNSGGEGVFEPTAVQPPSFERGSLAGPPAAARAPDAGEGARSRKSLSVPAR